MAHRTLAQPGGRVKFVIGGTDRRLRAEIRSAQGLIPAIAAITETSRWFILFIRIIERLISSDMVGFILNIVDALRASRNRREAETA